MSERRLISIDELADELGMKPRAAREKLHADGWPHVALSRKNIRFEPDQVDQIIARYRKTGKREEVAGLPGQTARSARGAR